MKILGIREISTVQVVWINDENSRSLNFKDFSAPRLILCIDNFIFKYLAFGV